MVHREKTGGRGEVEGEKRIGQSQRNQLALNDRAFSVWCDLEWKRKASQTGTGGSSVIPSDGSLKVNGV